MVTAGHKYGRLTAMQFEYRNKHSKQYWTFKCDCGNEKICREDAVARGSIQSCGCLPKEICWNNVKNSIIKHKASYTRLYKILTNMKKRCYNPKFKQYNNYGGRGIKICEEWLNNPQSFIDWALSNGYNDNLTIDKIDNDKDYSPDNCQWITRSENSRKHNKKVVNN